MLVAIKLALVKMSLQCTDTNVPVFKTRFCLQIIKNWLVVKTELGDFRIIGITLKV